MTTRDPQTPATLADIAEARGVITKEVQDIVAAAVKLQDDDPTNNAGAILEIVQSLGVIGATIVGIAAGTVYMLSELGLL